MLHFCTFMLVVYSKCLLILAWGCVKTASKTLFTSKLLVIMDGHPPKNATIATHPIHPVIWGFSEYRALLRPLVSQVMGVPPKSSNLDNFQY